MCHRPVCVCAQGTGEKRDGAPEGQTGHPLTASFTELALFSFAGRSAQSAAAIDSTWTISPLNLRRRWGSLWRQVAGRHALLRRMHPGNTIVGVTRYIFASPSLNSLPPMQQKCTLAATTPIRLVADITPAPQPRQQSIFPFHGPERGGFRGHAQ